ncbi:MAG: acylphosphatase [Nitrososphaeria archaeon]|nr:acylphosphatase [Nitrososphaeria archaeon]
MRKLVSANIYVSGIVQGVFFRAYTRSKARSLGITGWVKNLPDGRVQIFAEGEEDSIKKLIDWCKVGPPHAVVEDVKVEWLEYCGKYRTFDIIY